MQYEESQRTHVAPPSGCEISGSAASGSWGDPASCWSGVPSVHNRHRLRNSMRSCAARRRQDSGARRPGRKDGRTVFERGYGVRDLRALRKIDARHGFPPRVLHQAVHRDGRHASGARRQAPLRPAAYRNFPGFPPYARAITVRHLLTHTVGTARLRRRDGRAPVDARTSDTGRRSARAAPTQAKPQFAAGANWAVQQFRLRAAGPDRREGFRRALRTSFSKTASSSPCA